MATWSHFAKEVGQQGLQYHSLVAVNQGGVCSSQSRLNQVEPQVMRASDETANGGVIIVDGENLAKYQLYNCIQSNESVYRKNAKLYQTSALRTTTLGVVAAILTEGGGAFRHNCFHYQDFGSLQYRPIFSLAGHRFASLWRSVCLDERSSLCFSGGNPSTEQFLRRSSPVQSSDYLRISIRCDSEAGAQYEPNLPAVAR